MVRNKLRWDAENAVGKQRNSYESSPTSICFESPTALLASQHSLFRTIAYVSEDELCEKCIIKQLLNSVFA